MCRPPSCRAASATMRSTCSLLVTSAATGTMRRFVAAASSRAVASRSPLFRATIATSTPSRANSRANGFADAPTATSHDRMLALQSEVHGTLSPWRPDCDFLASLLIVLSEGTWRKGVAGRWTMYGTCLHSSGRAAAARARHMGAPSAALQPRSVGVFAVRQDVTVRNASPAQKA